MNEPIAVVLAAGKGTRMKSDLAKVLFPVCGRPMIHHVLDALQAAGVEQSVIIVGYQQEKVRETLASRAGVDFAVQSEQLGTGHAVQQARPLLVKLTELAGHDGPIIVVAGDSPLLQPQSLQKLLVHFQQTRPACCLGR